MQRFIQLTVIRLLLIVVGIIYFVVGVITFWHFGTSISSGGSWLGFVALFALETFLAYLAFSSALSCVDSGTYSPDRAPPPPMVGTFDRRNKGKSLYDGTLNKGDELPSTPILLKDQSTG